MPTVGPLSPFTSWGLVGVTTGIVVWVIYALLRGNLVSRRVVDERVKDWEARLAQALENSQFWKEAAEAYKQANSEMMPVLDQILDNHRTTLGILNGLKEIGESRGD
jgi:hypothetical protein